MFIFVAIDMTKMKQDMEFEALSKEIENLDRNLKWRGIPSYVFFSAMAAFVWVLRPKFHWDTGLFFNYLLGYFVSRLGIELFSLPRAGMDGILSLIEVMKPFYGEFKFRSYVDALISFFLLLALYKIDGDIGLKILFFIYLAIGLIFNIALYFCFDRFFHWYEKVLEDSKNLEMANRFALKHKMIGLCNLCLQCLLVYLASKLGNVDLDALLPIVAMLIRKRSMNPS